MRQQIYLRALATLPLISFHYGHFTTWRDKMPLADPPEDGARFVRVIKTKEKCSDVNLASYLILDASRKLSDLAVVVSNDSDFTEAIRLAQEELDIKVGLINPRPSEHISKRLQDLPCVFFKQILPELLKGAQLPSIVCDSEGEVQKPRGW